jgi:hypothetical protein
MPGQPHTLQPSDIAEYITGNDPNLKFIQTIGAGGQGQVHIVFLSPSFKVDILA